MHCRTLGVVSANVDLGPWVVATTIFIPFLAFERLLLLSYNSILFGFVDN